MYEELNKSLEESHRNLLNKTIELKKELLNCEKKFKNIFNYFLISLFVNFITLLLLYTILLGTKL